jgi:hypothetical protein
VWPLLVRTGHDVAADAAVERCRSRDNTGDARERDEQAEIGARQTLSAGRWTSRHCHAEGSAAVAVILPGSRGSLVLPRGAPGLLRRHEEKEDRMT